VRRLVRKRAPEMVCDVSRDPDDAPLIANTRAKILILLMSHGGLIGVLSQVDASLAHSAAEKILLTPQLWWSRQLA
jgi:hypothetical protein